MAELKSLRAEVAQLGRANETLTTASASSRRGPTRHGVDGRVRRRIRRSFRDRADMPSPRRIAGSRARHASRLPHVQIQTRQPHGRQARSAGPRHPSGPLGFLHGRVRVQEDAAQLIAQGWDPAEISRGRVLSVFLVKSVFRVGAGAVLLDSSLIPSPPIMPQDRARVDDP